MKIEALRQKIETYNQHPFSKEFKQRMKILLWQDNDDKIMCLDINHNYCFWFDQQNRYTGVIQIIQEEEE